MHKVLVIGIDSMDSLLVDRYIDLLPNIRRLRAFCPDLAMTSVFPPDSDTAWASIYTGLHPAHHGVVHFVDPLEKTSIYQTTDYLNSASIRGRTFWDRAGDAGRRVCLITPHIGHPVWDVNGFMISRIPKTGGFETFPPDFRVEFDLQGLMMPMRIPNSKSEYGEYLTTLRDVVLQERAFGLEMAARRDWDLFFFYSSALDFVQHIFWNYCDPCDPMYPGDDNPLRETIPEFYRLYDSLIGAFAESVDEDTAILVLSDHGHGMRPVDLVNVNEILRREGYLFSKEGVCAPVLRIKETVKREAVNIIQKTALRGTALAMLRRYPGIKELYTVPSSIDFERTVAHCTDLSGMKSYSYGGIVLSGKHLGSGRRYRETRDDIVDLLAGYTLPGSAERAFAWVKEREGVYDGAYLHKYPDILFQLKDGYGAGWAIGGPISSRSSTHSFYPGSHRGDTPVCYLANADGMQPARRDCTLMDIAPTILDLLGVSSGCGSCDGRSLFAP
ncbi:MAG: alkaline phosphatase family protein [Methanomicrobiaceae archaeon]|uniref:Uncharacterized protein n=1 Tax=hydrocarbon metagenome TaxID=938273 RepID=A0A0W8FKB3_9ZZZZ|nr:alkaline phosphatase family protein [Methanomicrobiaceae archaeon]MDD5419163.1 alkaline phosphatase family protein [Methanomicrobiaceae archaeon]